MVSYTKRTDVFFTPAQVACFINGYLLEDACFLRYDVIDNWTPHYGYNDTKWRSVSTGQTMVSGELGIVFRYEGYLTRLIDLAQEMAADYNADSVAALRQGSAHAVSDELLQQDTSVLINFLDDSASDTSQVAFEAASKFLKSRFWGAEEEAPWWAADPHTTVKSAEAIKEMTDVSNYHRPSTRKSPNNLNLRIVHGPEGNVAQPNYAREIKLVQFRGQSYEADIRVPDGSSVITEVYPFIARDVGTIPFTRNRA